MDLVSRTGADELLVLDFNEVKDMEPEEYLKNVILYRCIADTLIMGEDYRFGKDARGDVTMIKEFAKENDIRVIVVEAFAHRMLLSARARTENVTAEQVIGEILEHTPVPRLRRAQV